MAMAHSSHGADNEYDVIMEIVTDNDDEEDDNGAEYNESRRLLAVRRSAGSGRRDRGQQRHF